MLLKQEIKRAFSGRYFFISLSIGMAIVLWHFIQITFFSGVDLEEAVANNYCPLSLYNTWIGYRSGIQRSIYFVIMPILAALPFGDTYFTDIKNGYAKNILIKRTRTNFALSKYVAVFLSGGITIAVPLVADLLLCALFFPAIDPDAFTRTFPIFPSDNFMGNLFIVKPLLYTFIYIFLDFFLSGFIGCLCLPLSLVLINKYLVLVAPFLICFILNELQQFVYGFTFSPDSFAIPDINDPNVTWLSFIILFAVLFSLTFIPFIASQRKRDIF
jgi:hypothetical protein